MGVLNAHARAARHIAQGLDTVVQETTAVDVRLIILSIAVGFLRAADAMEEEDRSRAGKASGDL